MIDPTSLWVTNSCKVAVCGLSSKEHLIVQINWGSTGGFYYIPLKAQRKIFDRIGRKRYIKLPKPGTNPRGVEITRDALMALVNDDLSRSIEIRWQKTKIDFNPYKRWVDQWRED